MLRFGMRKGDATTQPLRRLWTYREHGDRGGHPGWRRVRGVDPAVTSPDDPAVQAPRPARGPGRHRAGRAGPRLDQARPVRSGPRLADHLAAGDRRLPGADRGDRADTAPSVD